MLNSSERPGASSSPWCKSSGGVTRPGAEGATSGRSRNAAPRSPRSRPEAARNPLGDGRLRSSALSFAFSFASRRSPGSPSSSLRAERPPQAHPRFFLRTTGLPPRTARVRGTVSGSPASDRNTILTLASDGDGLSRCRWVFQLPPEAICGRTRRCGPPSGSMVRMSSAAAVCESLSTTLKVNGKAPVAAGAPDRRPRESSCRPGGSIPSATRQTYGGLPPRAVSGCE